MAANDVILRLSNSEYERLLKTVYLGNWLLTSNNPEPDRDVERFESKIFSYAASAGLRQYADFDEATELFSPADALHEEQEVSAAIFDYDSEVFWEELSQRLAERELEKHGDGPEKKEYFDALWDRKDRYDYEFEEFGIENVFVVKNPFLKTLLRILSGRLGDRPEDDGGDEECACPECAAKLAAGEPLQKRTTAESPPEKE
ncbi:MAG: hypothetical protein HY550_05140 [Elusimicrobia bacterium]|nr:hypothetical protein [Elusimicrobiota bacterium]